MSTLRKQILQFSTDTSCTEAQSTGVPAWKLENQPSPRAPSPAQHPPSLGRVSSATLKPHSSPCLLCRKLKQGIWNVPTGGPVGNKTLSPSPWHVITFPRFLTQAHKLLSFFPPFLRASFPKQPLPHTQVPSQERHKSSFFISSPKGEGAHRVGTEPLRKFISSSLTNLFPIQVCFPMD